MRPPLPRTTSCPPRQSTSSSRSRATSTARSPSRAISNSTARSRSPTAVDRSQQVSSAVTASSSAPTGSPANRHPATDGTTDDDVGLQELGGPHQAQVNRRLAQATLASRQEPIPLQHHIYRSLPQRLRNRQQPSLAQERQHQPQRRHAPPPPIPAVRTHPGERRDSFNAEPGRIQALLLQPAAQMRQHVSVVLGRPRREPLTDQLLPERMHPLGQRPARPHRIPTLCHHDTRLLRPASVKETASARSYAAKSPNRDVNDQRGYEPARHNVPPLIIAVMPVPA